MARIIKLTLLADFGSCLIMLFLLTFAEGFKTGFYASSLIFGNILLPTFGAVLVFVFIKRWMIFNSSIITVLVQVILLTILLNIGLFVWATIDCLIEGATTWQNLKEDYNSQFKGFLPIVFFEAILIPTFDLLLTTRKNKQANNQADTKIN